jgi:hypothetical protein
MRVGIGLPAAVHSVRQPGGAGEDRGERLLAGNAVLLAKQGLLGRPALGTND